MADIDKLLDDENQQDENRVEKRFRNLEDKVKLTNQEKEELAKAKTQLETEKQAAIKQANFYKDFSKLSSKYQAAPEHIDEIEAKVMAGYDPEDATVSVLAKAGKLSSAPKPVERDIVAGGSAVTTPPTGGAKKSVTEMTQAERREAIMQAEREGEDILKTMKGMSIG